MTSKEISIQAIFSEDGEITHFLFQNDGGKFAMFDCSPSKAESVQEFLREATFTKLPDNKE
jgi:hypothetical protein